MKRVGTINEWYRFLDANSDDEAVSTLMTLVARLDLISGELRYVMSRVAYSPGHEVDGVLTIAFDAIGEAMEILENVAARFRAGERTSA